MTSMITSVVLVSLIVAASSLQRANHAPDCIPYTDEEMFKYFPKGSRFPPSGPCDGARLRQVERVDVSTLRYEDFFKNYVYPNKPVLIAGAAQHLFNDALEGWTPQEMMNAPFADMDQPVVQSTTRIMHEDTWMNIRDLYAEPGRTVLRYDNRTFDSISSPLPNNMSYFNFQKQWFGKLKNNTFLNRSESKREDHYNFFNLHLSNQGGTLPHSHTQTLNILFYGAKRWIMVNPMDYPDSDARSVFEKQKMSEMQRGTPQEWYSEEALGLLDKYRLPYYDFVTKPGDAVFIPDHWTHGTIDLCRNTVGVEMQGHMLASAYKPCWTVGLTYTKTAEFVKFQHIEDPDTFCKEYWQEHPERKDQH